MKTLNQFLIIKLHDVFKSHIICNDGFTISIQGSRFHYCNPKELSEIYNSMELGYPSEEESLISDYAENKYDLCNTIYPYVPYHIIEEVIDKHGGINVEKTFENQTFIIK